MMPMDYHSPVLLNEAVGGLDIKNDGVYVDVTFGGGFKAVRSGYL
jgi:16S rRNA (cytosine1402-N4)-methyltransferase